MRKIAFQFGVTISLLVLSACAGTTTSSETETKNQLTQLGTKPKLVVGIVIDQMRYDYLYRYWDKYSEGGFKKLVRQGFNFKNNHYSYVPTYTGPGHASVYTGSVPAIHGIIGNSWYRRENNRTIYCAEDKSVETVGSPSRAGQMSPVNMLTTTVTDELRLSNNMQSKVIGIALKDRGSILPAGHTANGAYWFDSQTGNWITSTYYSSDLPEWVKSFNNKKYPDHHLSQVWNTLLPIDQYIESTADDQPWEEALAGESKPVFPHNLPAIRKQDYELLRYTPGGNTITKDFAIAALKAEGLGKGTATDFLALSFSTPDYVGHSFGPNSIEVQDMYLRLDKEIEDLLNVLEQEVGKENVLIFLTADHGAANVPAFMKSQKIPAGVSSSAMVRDSVEQMLDKTYGEGKWVESYMNQQVYLNRKLIEAKKLKRAEVQEKVANYVIRFEGVARAVSADNMQQNNWSSGMMAKVEQGYNVKRSGDVILLLEPGWFEGWGEQEPKGTTHGSQSNYDTHVPLLWYGWKIKPGESTVLSEITDIAPTIASWLNIQEPNGSVGKPLQQYMK